MNDLNVETSLPRGTQTPSRRKKNPKVLIVFIGIWLVLIGSGVYGAKWYSDQIQQTVTADLEQQTAAQIADMQQAYEERLQKLESSYTTEMTELKGKVDALNELLQFTKDNADSKTDNSNKLYTQLNEVKKQLDELKKGLDVLK